MTRILVLLAVLTMAACATPAPRRPPCGPGEVVVRWGDGDDARCQNEEEDVP